MTIFAKRYLCLPCAFLFVAALGVAQVAAPTSIIEVGDGNSVPEALNCDWDLLNNTFNNDSNTPGTPCGVGASINAYVFKVGGVTQNRFTQGSKDNQPIDRWRWDANGSPDKDALTHGYAISYTHTSSGHRVLAFGAERFAVNGDANIGIWFFQKTVAPNPNGRFDGEHTDGDVFAVSAFTGGGGHPELDVYKWDSTCSAPNYPNNPSAGACSETNFRLLFKGTGGSLCTATSAGCASVNSADITIGWPYQAKFGIPGNTVPPNGFFEGGFDLSALFGSADLPCFSSFLIDTRTSQSVSASTKDFLSGSFPECKIEVSKACQCTGFDPAGPNQGNNTGFNYSFSGTVSNTGGGTVYNVTVSDQGKSYSCGSLTAGQSKNFPSASCTGPAATFTDDVFPSSNQASATATTGPSGGTTLTAQTNVVSCSGEATPGACTPNPQLTVDKTCVTALQVLGTNVVVRVDYTGQVHNNGSVNLGNVQVTEDHGADGTVDVTFSMGTMAPSTDKCYTKAANDATQPNCPALTLPNFNAATVTGAASYFPSSGTGVNPGRVQFSDTVRATGVNPFGGGTISSHPAGGGVTATCLVCPFGACPTPVP